jgi:hypothetical protein
MCRVLESSEEVRSDLVRVIVVTPPVFVPAAPAAAPSVLVAELRRRGHDAVAFDASRFAIDRLLAPRALERSLQRVVHGSLPPSVEAYASGLPLTIRGTVEALRSRDTYRDLDRYRVARHEVELAFSVHALAHGRSRWTSVEFRGDHDRDSAEETLEAVAHGDEIFDGPLSEAAAVIAQARPRVVALSVSFPEQIYGCLRLARSVRELLPEAYVIAGGATLTRLRNSILHLPTLFDIVDAIGLREGENLLTALVDALAAGEDPLTCVPGVMARRGGRVVLSMAADGPPYQLHDTATPVFEDLSPGPYLAPSPCFPVSTTRNCYFDRCTFCAISRSFNAAFRQMPPARMASQILELASRHPDARFKDVSEAIPPFVLLETADELARSGDPPAWEAYVRFERPFHLPGIAARLRRGGLRIAYFGLESASPVQLEETHKKVAVDVASETLRRFADAGIWCHLFLISGLPRETERDHEATLDFIARHRTCIHSIQASVFRLELDSDAARMPERYGFRPAPRPATSLRVDLELEDRGDIPPRATAERRAMDFRRAAAFDGSDDTLARSRLVWDAHWLAFAALNGGPVLPGAGVPQAQTIASRLKFC